MPSDPTTTAPNGDQDRVTDSAATVPIENARRAAIYAYLSGAIFGIGMTAFICGVIAGWWL